MPKIVPPNQNEKKELNSGGKEDSIQKVSIRALGVSVSTGYVIGVLIVQLFVFNLMIFSLGIAFSFLIVQMVLLFMYINLKNVKRQNSLRNITSSRHFRIHPRI